jgi:hypothetical protein
MGLLFPSGELNGLQKGRTKLRQLKKQVIFKNFFQSIYFKNENKKEPNKTGKASLCLGEIYLALLCLQRFIYTSDFRGRFCIELACL